MNRRILFLALAALAVLAAPSVVAAAAPTLTATVIPGQEIDVAGSGFPADADVLLAIERNGAEAGSQALRTDAAGTFSATIDAGPGRGGVYTVTASSGSASATVEALAVETAGGIGGTQPSPPPTDTAARTSSKPVVVDGRAIGLVALVIGLVAAAGRVRRSVAEDEVSRHRAR